MEKNNFIKFYSFSFKIQSLTCFQSLIVYSWLGYIVNGGSLVGSPYVHSAL